MNDPLPGAHPGYQIAVQLVLRLRNQAILPALYPPLFGEGIEEGSLHAYMLSALVLLGQQLGFAPVSDMPVFDRLDKLLTGDGAKRPDAVWFSSDPWQIRCLIEFERFAPHALRIKAQNLLVMGKQLQQSLHLVALIYWTYAPLEEKELREARHVFEQGFLHPTGVYFPRLACPVLMLETVVFARNERTMIERFSPRLLVLDGENKPYLVDNLTR